MNAEKFWPALGERLGRALEGAVPRGSTCVYLDYTLYPNPGDLLIYLGTEAWIEAQGLVLLGRWNRYDFAFPPLPEGTVILCQGGGNFGDLYPFQRFREAVVRAYPGHRIVFLPQTIHYESARERSASAEILNRHPDLHLFLRDRESLAAAEEHFPACKSRLAPDMSTCLYPAEETLGLEGRASAGEGVLYLLRRDRERRPDEPLPDPASGWVGDWRELLGHRVWRLRLVKAAARLLGRRVPSRLIAFITRSSAREIARHCARRFRGAERIVTSRLHGHILASLLGVPNELLDNRYGKNSRYFSTWHRDLPIARLAEGGPRRHGHL